VWRGSKLVAAACCGVVLLAAGSSCAGAASSKVIGKVRIWKIAYRAHDGVRRYAYLALPRSYRRGHPTPIPLVISPHGRGVSGRANVKLWGQLPAIGDFAVISPDGQGRRLPNYSWGSSGQISDLSHMPGILHATLPWVRIDPKRIYAVGGSMGGQETLLLLGRHPHLLAGAAAFDPVVDFALQYHEFPKLRCKAACRREWDGPIGRSLQSLARSEVGGSPHKVPYAYELRSPITYARAIAFSGVPLQIWWSPRDRIVIDQQRQAARFFKRLLKLNPKANVVGFTGAWRHSAEMRAKTRLPSALAALGLLPSSHARFNGLHLLGPKAPVKPVRESPRALVGPCGTSQPIAKLENS
jgi:pimeloyl-ACP methyl ester carboxylesterase